MQVLLTPAAMVGVAELCVLEAGHREGARGVGLLDVQVYTGGKA